MKLYTGFAPNAFRVAVFLDEKSIEVPVHQVEVLAGETREASHLQRNSLGEIPVLELDSGEFLTESVAICRYLESLYPDHPLLGRNALDSARVEMWNRRMEQQIMAPYGQLGLHTMPLFADKLEQIPAYADSQRRRIDLNWRWLEGELQDGRPFITGEDFTIADITGMTALMIGGFMNVPVPTDLNMVNAWVNRVQSRPSWRLGQLPNEPE